MTRSYKALLGVPALAAMIALSTGCATNKQLEEVRAMAEDAQQTASEAKSMAADASTQADQANQRTMDTDKKIDRMFKKSMEK